jgi:hypothetical protein
VITEPAAKRVPSPSALLDTVALLGAARRQRSCQEFVVAQESEAWNSCKLWLTTTSAMSAAAEHETV